MRSFYAPNFDPIICTIGSISFYWYGLMYVLSFVFSIQLLKNRNYTLNKNFCTKKEIEYLLNVNILGVLIGGRIGYVILYQYSFFSENLLWIFKIWEGGMSFHGGLIGVIISIAWFSYYKNKSFFQVSDFIVPMVPIGLGLGRLGNFINGELWGRVTVDVPWAMLFQSAKLEDLLWVKQHPEWQSVFNYYGALPRHPSQLYEMFLEGIILYIVIYVFTQKCRSIGSTSGLFLIFYGLFRIIVECFREPDSHLGLFYNLFTMGQILSFPMIFFGIIILFLSKKNWLKIN